MTGARVRVFRDIHGWWVALCPCCRRQPRWLWGRTAPSPGWIIEWNVDRSGTTIDPPRRVLPTEVAYTLQWATALAVATHHARTVHAPEGPGVPG